MSRQAITVKFLCPTNFRGSRYKAVAEAGSMTVDSDHALSADENAYRAGMMLAHRYEWDEYYDYVLGGLPGGGYVLVAVDKAEKKDASSIPEEEDAGALISYVDEHEEDWTDGDPRIRGRRALNAAHCLIMGIK